jgi:hypothetical protein
MSIEMKEKFLSWLAPISNAGMVIAVITFFVSDHQRILAISTVMSAYEVHGTPAAVTMRATYDEKFRATDGRLERLESALSSIQTIKETLVEIRGNQLRLEVKLNQHMESKKQ